MNFSALLTTLSYNYELDYNEIKKILDWDGKMPYDYNHADKWMNIIITYIIVSCGRYVINPKSGWITNFKLFNEIKDDLAIWCDIMEV